MEIMITIISGGCQLFVRGMILDISKCAQKNLERHKDLNQHLNQVPDSICFHSLIIFFN